TPQRVEDLVEGLQGGALAPGLVGREHALGDPRLARDLVLLPAAPVAEPAQSRPEAVQDGCTHVVSLPRANGRGARKGCRPEAAGPRCMGSAAPFWCRSSVLGGSQALHGGYLRRNRSVSQAAKRRKNDSERRSGAAGRERGPAEGRAGSRPAEPG